MTSPSTGLAAHRGSSYSLIGHDANYWRDFRYPWPAAAAGARGTCRLRQVNPRCYIFGLPAPLVCLYPRFCVACVLAQNCASIISHRERRIASLWPLSVARPAAEPADAPRHDPGRFVLLPKDVVTAAAKARIVRSLSLSQMAS
jgi:hypothetical protein